MANIPMYSRVQTDGDLQNLVTGIILRQDKPFTNDEIIEQVTEKLHGSYFETEGEAVKQKVLRTIQYMWMGGCLRSFKFGEIPIRWRLTMSFPAYNPQTKTSNK